MFAEKIICRTKCRSGAAFTLATQKRMGGVIAHAVHPMSAGKLEGFDNRIKVAEARELIAQCRLGTDESV